MTVKRSIPVDQLEAGMKLAEALKDSAGRMLIPAKTELSASMIESLKRRSVGMVDVEMFTEIDQAAKAAALRQLETRIAHLFRKTGEDELTSMLRQTVAQFRQEQLS